MSYSLIVDLVIIAVLGLFIFLGAKKGFILTLCGFLAGFIALMGALYLANLFGPRLADAIQPKIQESIQKAADWAAAQQPETVKPLRGGESRVDDRPYARGRAYVAERYEGGAPEAAEEAAAEAAETAQEAVETVFELADDEPRPAADAAETGSDAGE